MTDCSERTELSERTGVVALPRGAEPAQRDDAPSTAPAGTPAAPPHPAPAGGFRGRLACLGRAVRAAHSSSVPF